MVTVNVDAELNNNMLVIGAGEAGGRIAQEFSYQGFQRVVAINTAKADLEGLDIDEGNKFMIPVTGGQGAGKNPNVVRNAADTFYDDLLKFIQTKSVGVEYVVVCIGGGGGSGGGLGTVIAEIVSELGIPVGMIYTLPLMNESTLVFVNALDNLKEVHANASTAAISPLIIVDNNKLVSEFSPTAANFWAPLNSAIVTVIRKFNEYSQKPSKFISALDRQDLKRLWSTGGTCAIGSFEIGEDYDDEKIQQEVYSHFFMDGFDLKTASACGLIIVGSEEALQTGQAAKVINSTFDKVSGYLEGGMFFRGVYSDENVKYLKAYILFNGLVLPSEHIDDMMKQVRAGYSKMKTQQNRLDDGVHVDFGSGVGGLFNDGGGSKKIVRKHGQPEYQDQGGGQYSSSQPRAPRQQQAPKEINNNPTNTPGVKRGSR